jgi:hypothetical protein
MQTGKARLRKIAFRIFIVAATVYSICAAFSVFVAPTQYADCERNTKELNGGERSISGHKLKVVLCGDGGDENFNNDKIRMQVFSAGGELLAQRKFIVNWHGSGPFPLEYGSGHLTYFDASKGGDFEHKLNLPPSPLDWIRARVPLAD